MPSPMYNNASLRKLIAPEDEVKDVSYWHGDEPDFAGRGKATDSMQGPDLSADDLLASAHGTLDSANQLGAATHSADIASIPERMDSLASTVGSRPSLRQLTSSLSAAGLPLMLGSFATGPAAPVALTGGSLMTAPDIMRRLISPDADESRLGAVVEGGLTALPGVLGLRSMAKAEAAAQAAEAASPAAGVRNTVETARDYLTKGATRGQAAQRAGWPLGMSADVPIADTEKTLDYPGMKKLFPYQQEDLSAGRATRQMTQDVSDASNLRGKWGGDRSTGSFEGTNGLANLQNETPHAMPNDRTHADIDSLVKMLGLDEGSLPELEFAGQTGDDAMLQHQFEAGKNTIPTPDVLRRLLRLK